MKTITVHKMFEEDGEPLFFVTNDGVKVKELSKVTQLEKYLKSLDEGDVIRVTNAGVVGLGIVGLIQDMNLQVVTAHWHATGIEKNLEPEALVKAFHALSADLFAPVILRSDLMMLRAMVGVRQALIDRRKATQLKLSAATRALGLADNAEKPEWLAASEEDLAEDTKKTETPVEREINQLAKKIPECVMLNDVLGVKTAWQTAAAMAVYIGDINRFATVSKLWAYAGQSVVDGKAPKRTKGEAQNWNAKLRVILWMWATSMIKNMNSPWRPVYDAYRAAELLVHEAKCEKCTAMKCATEAQREKKTQVISSHCGARARRRVVKDVLKRYFVKARGLDQRTYDTPYERVEPSMTATA